jgi:hypothetical protein
MRFVAARGYELHCQKLAPPHSTRVSSTPSLGAWLPSAVKRQPSALTHCTTSYTPLPSINRLDLPLITTEAWGPINYNDLAGDIDHFYWR